MKKRIITGFFLIIILVPLTIIGGPIFFTVVGLGVLTATFEMFNMFDHNQEEKMPLVPKIISSLLAVGTYAMLTYLWNNNEIQSYNFDVYPFCIAFLFLQNVILLSMFVFTQKFNSKHLARTFLIINYVAFGFSALSFLRCLGIRFIIYLLLLTASTDAFAYIFGIKLGKHKMAPTISPKKSWEGAIFGTLFGTVLSTLFAFFYGNIFQTELWNKGGEITLLENFCSLGENQDIIQFLVIFAISLAGSILGQFGDLVASKFKRTYDIKDYGKVFPGHGGVMDRFDSAIFVAMALVGIFIFLRMVFPLPL